jgi:hypothetical protein
MTLALAACGGGNNTSDEIPPPPEEAEGQVIERSRSDQVAAERRERERQRLAQRDGDARFALRLTRPIRCQKPV